MNNLLRSFLIGSLLFAIAGYTCHGQEKQQVTPAEQPPREQQMQNQSQNEDQPQEQQMQNQSQNQDQPQEQQKQTMVKFSNEFRFNDGIYLNFEEVKSNRPIPKAKLLTSLDYNDREFFKKIFEADKIYFYDDMGIRKEVPKASIWGYARNGVLYVQIQENFNRITFVGSICHFVADITTYDSRYYNSPYGYYDPYYSPYGYGNYYSPYGYNNYYSPYRQNNLARTELKQYIIDFESGKVLEFDVENTEILLMKDQKLYEEYVQLSRKKKKELMFVYIRKFNENNPLYLPSN